MEHNIYTTFNEIRIEFCVSGYILKFQGGGILGRKKNTVRNIFLNLSK